MSPEQAMVKEFRQKFRFKCPAVPTMPTDSNMAYHASNLDDEMQEYFEAAHERNFVGMAQELCDIIYFAYGAATEMGIDLAPFFAEVHAANMRKTGGKRRQDGKILKPKGWQPPDMDGILGRMTPTAA